MDTVHDFSGNSFVIFLPGEERYFRFDKPLRSGEQYYWKVRAYHENDTTSWSDSWRFTIDEYSNLGLEEFGEAISIYPNPVRDRLHIEFNSPADHFQSVQVIDCYGRKVISNENGLSNDSEIHLNFDGLEPGLYYLVVVNENTRTAKKLIKL
jgi:hypothetical protein